MKIQCLCTLHGDVFCLLDVSSDGGRTAAGCTAHVWPAEAMLTSGWAEAASSLTVAPVRSLLTTSSIYGSCNRKHVYHLHNHQTTPRDNSIRPYSLLMNEEFIPTRRKSSICCSLEIAFKLVCIYKCLYLLKYFHQICTIYVLCWNYICCMYETYTYRHYPSIYQ